MWLADFLDVVSSERIREDRVSRGRQKVENVHVSSTCRTLFAGRFRVSDGGEGERAASLSFSRSSSCMLCAHIHFFTNTYLFVFFNTNFFYVQLHTCDVFVKVHRRYHVIPQFSADASICEKFDNRLSRKIQLGE